MTDCAVQLSPVSPQEKALEGIRSYITYHDLKPGDALPSERDLAEKLGVSRTALRGAIAILISGFELESRRGSGTFVAAPPLLHIFEETDGFSSTAEALGHVPGSKVLGATLVEASARVALRLEVEPGTTVFELRRIRTVDGQVCSLDTSWVNWSNLPDVANHDYAEESLYEVLERAYGIQAAHGEERITITMVDEREAELLGLAPGDPVFFCQAVERDARRVPFEYVRQLIRPDRYHFASNDLPTDLKEKVGRQWLYR